MPTVAGKIRRKRATALEWRQMRRLYETGDSYAEISRCYGLDCRTVSLRAKKEGWEAAKRGLGDGRMPVPPENPLSDPETAESVVATSTDGEKPQPEDNCNLVALPQDLRGALTAAANAEPGELQQAFGRVAQVIVSRGITSIPLPRTVQELKTWFEIFRKAHGLDQPAAKDAGQAGLLGSMRTVSRRTVPVAESRPPVEPDPDEGIDMAEVLGLT